MRERKDKRVEEKWIEKEMRMRKDKRVEEKWKGERKKGMEKLIKNRKTRWGKKS